MTDPALAIATPFVAKFEGYRAAPYRDTGLIWTQGFGCTAHPDGSKVAQSDPPVTEAEAMDWMGAILAPTMARVRELVRVPISDSAAAALCSFGYNCGTGALSRSTLLRLLNEGAPATQVADQFGAWVHDARGNIDAGLRTRRAAERALFLTPTAPAEDEADKLMDVELKEINT